MSDSTRSRCRLQRLFGHASRRSISMYESPLTHERDSELRLSRSQLFINAYKRLSSPKKIKARRLSGVDIYPGLLAPESVMAVLSRELEPESTPDAVLTSHRMSESYLSGRPLSPSFLSLTPSPAGYQPPEYISSPSDYNYNPSSEYPSSFEYEYPSPEPRYQPPSACHSPPSICGSALSRIKPTKRKPPPLIINDSFHSTTSHQSHTLAVPDTNPELSPQFTPVSPRYRMIPSEEEQFRRRLLKLQRTLGERMTPGLIIQPKPSPELTASTGDYDPHQRPAGNLIFPTKRSALHAPTDQDLVELDSSLSKSLPLPPTRRKTSSPVPSSPNLHRHYLPETVTLTPLTLTAFVGSVSTPRTVTTARSFEFVLDCDVQDSWFSDDDDDNDDDDDSYPPSPFHSGWSPTFFDVEGDDDTVVVDIIPRCWGLDRGGTRRDDDVSDAAMPDTPGVTRRQEARYGWSGEWNQPHIRDVIELLRSL